MWMYITYPFLKSNAVLNCVDNGLVPSGTAQPMLTSHYWGSLAFTWEQFQKKYSKNYSLGHVFEDYTFKINTTSPRGQWVKINIISVSLKDIDCQEYMHLFSIWALRQNDRYFAMSISIYIFLCWTLFKFLIKFNWILVFSFRLWPGAKSGDKRSHAPTMISVLY